MRIVFSGMERTVPLTCERVSVLRVANNTLFCRICQSLISGRGEDALEPYSIWSDEGERLGTKDAFIVASDPFALPFRHKSLLGALHSRMQDDLFADEDERARAQDLHNELAACVARLGFQLNGDYCFTVEWSLSSYLKAFGFGIDLSPDLSLLENLIRFVDLAADMAIDEAILFVNLKTFLSKNDLEVLCGHIVFHRLKVLMLENLHTGVHCGVESEIVVDQHFLEYEIAY